MTNFKEALLAELTEQVTRQPEPVRRPVRQWAVAATGAATVLAAAAVVLVGAPQQQEPAFALTKQADGSFVLKWSDLDQDRFEEANRAMREAGARSRIYHVGEVGTCPGHDRTDLHYPSGTWPWPSSLRTGDGEWTWVIPRMPQDVTLVWFVDKPPPGTEGGVGFGFVAGPLPPCLQEERVDPPTGPAPEASAEVLTPSEPAGTPSASAPPNGD